MVTDLRNTDFVSFHIKPSITDETWNWIINELNAASLLTADGFISCVDLGFVRTSDGSRYNKNLHPTIEDRAVQVPGGHGNYYFGMFWRDKDFSIPIAYDEMTETQMRAITLLFAGDRKMWDIYFDEEPYKVWHVKITSPVQLNYICMDEPNNGSVNPQIVHNHMLYDTSSNNNVSNSNTRTYKGEGTISLKAYTPFARERFKYLNNYSENNKNEWKEASRLLDSQGTYDSFTNNVFNLWNAGDLPSDWQLILELEELSSGLTISNYSDEGHVNLVEDEDGSVHKLTFNSFVVQGSDTHIRINSALNIAEGGTIVNDSFVPSGNIYDKSRQSGKYFKLNRGASYIVIGAEGVTNATLIYHYRYF